MSIGVSSNRADFVSLLISRATGQCVHPPVGGCGGDARRGGPSNGGASISAGTGGRLNLLGRLGTPSDGSRAELPSGICLS